MCPPASNTHPLGPHLPARWRRGISRTEQIWMTFALKTNGGGGPGKYPAQLFLVTIKYQTGKYPTRLFPVWENMKHSLVRKDPNWSQSVEFNLRHLSTIWSCSKLQCGILTSRRMALGYSSHTFFPVPTPRYSVNPVYRLRSFFGTNFLMGNFWFWRSLGCLIVTCMTDIGISIRDWWPI